MPLAYWLHPITGQKVPLDYFDYDTSADGRAAYSPALARFCMLKQQRDERHRTLNVTTTRCLGCPRQTFLEVLFPYGLNPRTRAGLRDRSSLVHEALTHYWNPSVFFAEGVDKTTIAGTLFGVPISTQMDMLKFARDAGTHDDPRVPPRVVEIGDNKWGRDWSASYRNKPKYGALEAGTAKFDHTLQLNIMRLILAQQDWAIQGGFDPNTVLLTVYDYAESRDDGLGMPLKCEHMTEAQIAQAKPCIWQPWEDKFDQRAYDQGVTVTDIVREHAWAQYRYSQIPEGMRQERALVEKVVAPMRLIGQLGMYGGKMCDKYCDVKDLCDEMVRKYGANL